MDAARVDRDRVSARELATTGDPGTLPVDVRRTADYGLSLTLRGRDVAATELVLDLLTTFTEHIARAERAAGADRQEPTP